MEARTGLVVGGMAAVAVSVAVVSAVAFANTAALADAAGTSVASDHVVVAPAASPTATSDPVPAPASPDPLPPAEPEVVEAPAPVVVDAPPATAPAPATPAEPAAPVAPSDLESAIAAAKAAGSWEPIRTWALAQGWSGTRIDEFLSRLERRFAADDDDRSSQWGDGDRQGTVDGSWTQKSDTQKWSDTPDRPADAGSNVGQRTRAWHDGKKDQSRDSPDTRD